MVSLSLEIDYVAGHEVGHAPMGSVIVSHGVSHEVGHGVNHMVGPLVGHGVVSIVKSVSKFQSGTTHHHKRRV